MTDDSDASETGSGEAESSNGEPGPTNGETEPNNGEAEPSNGEAEPSNGEAEPSNGEAEPNNGETADSVSVEETQLPIDGTALVKAGAVASVPLSRLPELLYRVQEHLRDRIDEYRQSYERIHASAEREAFLVEDGHWAAVGDELGLADRAADAVRRAHEAQLEQFGSSADRREEIETALEIRTAVVIGVAEE